MVTNNCSLEFLDLYSMQNLRNLESFSHGRKVWFVNHQIYSYSVSTYKAFKALQVRICKSPNLFLFRIHI